MKNFIIFALLLSISSIVLARPNADELGICYSFDKNTLKNKGVCIISSGNSAGGGYTNIDYQGKTHLYEYEFDDTKNIYYRNSFYNRQKFDEIPDDERIFCYKDHPYDICFLHQ